MIKKPCQCTNPWYVENVQPILAKNPRLCVWCHGTKECEVYPNVDDVTENFGKVDWNKVEENWIENSIGITCECGDTLVVSEGNRACSCGRIYQFTCSLKVNETYFGKIDELLKAVEG